jgi:hypothetical protein
MRRLALLFLLAFCASTAQAAPASDDPVRLIKSIYAAYNKATLDPKYPDPYSQRLKALIAADEAMTEQGDAGLLDWDVFIDGQDWKLSELKITLVSRSASRAQVRASFKNLTKTCRIVFDLVREGDRWTIDEVRSMRDSAWSKPRWTMSKVLAGAPDAVPEENQ